MTPSNAVSTNRKPILVTGMPRSGTTWVGRMLCASKQAGYLNEPLNLTTSQDTFRIPVGCWYPYITSENEERLLPPLAEALEFEYPLARQLARCRNRTDLFHTLKTWRSFVESRNRRPLVKEPHAIFAAEWFARRLGSDVVVIVRHPAAVVASWKRLDWSFDFTHLLRQPALVRDWLTPFAAEMEAALAPSKDLVDRVALLWRIIYHIVAEYRERFPEFHVVRHEDLSRNPLAEYRRLYDVLSLPFTTEAADAVDASSGAENPKETRVENPHETRIDSRANLENWRGRLDADEITRIRLVTEETAILYYAEAEWT
jgi:Sulfotransferase domain